MAWGLRCRGTQSHYQLPTTRITVRRGPGSRPGQQQRIDAFSQSLYNLKFWYSILYFMMKRSHFIICFCVLFFPTTHFVFFLSFIRRLVDAGSFFRFFKQRFQAYKTTLFEKANKRRKKGPGVVTVPNYFHEKGIMQWRSEFSRISTATNSFSAVVCNTKWQWRQWYKLRHIVEAHSLRIIHHLAPPISHRFALLF